jgi:hypothetical protein
MSYEPGTRYGEPPEVEDPNLALAEADAGFTGPDITTDEQVLRAQVYEALRARVPGWEPHDGNLETWLTEDYTSIAAEIRALCQVVPNAIFTTYSEEVLGILPRLPTPALGHATFRAVDERGYTVAPGMELLLARTGDQLVAYEVVSGGMIEVGQREVADVDIRAIESGSAGNGLSGEAEPAEHLTWLESITVPSHTWGGDDGQDEEGFLDSLSQLLRVIAIRPILPADYALLALREVGVGRAIAMDGFRPSDRSWENARTITLLLTDAYGDPVDHELRVHVRRELERLREVNFLIYVEDADYSAPISVSYEATAFAEQDPEMVRELCDAAIHEALDRSRFRLGTTSPAITAGEVIPPPREGVEPARQTIRINDLIGILDRVRGIDFVEWVTIDGQDADRVMEGPTYLPTVGAVSGTVNLP